MYSYVFIVSANEGSVWVTGNVCPSAVGESRKEVVVKISECHGRRGGK